MSKLEIPQINTEDELFEFIRKTLSSKFLEPSEMYKSVPYIMAQSAYVVFEFVARQLGASLMQAQCADLLFLKKTRDLENGFAIIDYTDLLYPQYVEKFEKYTFNNLLKDNLVILQNRAKEFLEERPNAHPDVLKHWKMIINMR